MQPFELATMIDIVGRPKTTPPEGEQMSTKEPKRNGNLRRVSVARRTIGFWLIGLGGAVAGR